MQIIFSEEFKKDFKKIKDKSTRIKIINHLKKLEQVSESGKPLRYDLKGHRTIRVSQFRIIYRIEKESIIINCFDHRKDVYG
ncbi:MAG: type II toxin-antitoxin system mRNA interferase toxin, RelE/StbE family [Nanoarchaeota archaeon]|nr:type II toxin-antitoxin system mRNA interferase toxin, RelE/StbE family [Nanoarchaeota archaeon]MBU1005805.1 type II toxin-antitoxin system mRNA interferase toxin, RelE/StbE family [Nanoarchaeota archaeon]MBU1945430.1 type II toxin-antitoxin system mRNA interferase toxin, RelE/StbE family [Nanoarchaeota archaeon]